MPQKTKKPRPTPKPRQAFIIPGFGESSRTQPYRRIARAFQQQSIKPYIIDIHWPRRVMSDHIAEFMNIYETKVEPDAQTYFLGFSFGAMVALLASVYTNPHTQILCSLSPFFQEDLPTTRSWWKTALGHKRIDDFQTLSLDVVAPRVTAKTFILAGDKEGQEVARTAARAHRQLSDSQLIIIPGAKHDIRQPHYLAAIKKVISTI
ncbi:MAG: hypothetical protein A3F54_05580 [Candidatus Kerfeldbacteria bacterium RIFCSPHIGHO2_12_FULL_48_17]|uniref:Alpha/beta hydrolase n=1 Tax=Candidatus Kerfeldbacteria bacterium RIFCSPHIGHO2_12_FULL_48_17 TaxID=1798542 RepID=A0A1G2B5R7_9BACT|nr:MAG: hypothetical protein A3F54_05580 [Candidatus Kerfeldbacteria bacterium RIFCSPHIGHO2_12_FULL_48_17]